MSDLSTPPDPSQPPSARCYGFVDPRWTTLFTVVDAVGDAWRRLRRPRPAVHSPRRILLVNLAHIGDLVLTLPAVASLRRAHPRSHLAMMVGPWSEGVVHGYPHLDDVLVLRAPWWDRDRGRSHLALSTVLQMRSMIRRGQFDAVINFKSFFQENLAAALARVSVRIGYGIYGGGFLHTALRPFPWGAHAVHQHQLLATALGAPATPPRIELSISIRAIDEQAALEVLGSHSGPWIGMHLGSGVPSKQWALERFVELADRLTLRHGAEIVLVGGSEEAELAQRFTAGVRKPPRNAVGRTGVLATAALLRRCRAFVGSDSAPAHLAAAVGTPTVAIFSGTNRAAEWHPWGNAVEVLQEWPDCAPCGLAHCIRADHACMEWISVDRVEAAVTGLLSRSERP